MLIGYVRVSKSDGSQTSEPQRDALLAAGVDPARIYEDMASGRRDDRPGLVACLKAIQPGNTLVIWKLDRLGRDLRHLVNTVEDLRTRGIGLNVLAGAGAQIDTTTANGRLAFGIFAAFSEFERELIVERTTAGLAAARAFGRAAAQDEPLHSQDGDGGPHRSRCSSRQAARSHHHHIVCLRQRRWDVEGGGSGVAGWAIPRWQASEDRAPITTTAFIRHRRRVMPKGVAVPVEALATLRRHLAALPERHPERSVLIKSSAELYAVSRATLYRLLRGDRRPKDAHRIDRGHPRLMSAAEIERALVQIK
jgi:DNA invertase Pin-like site-specific DNA recombinase